MKRLRLTWTLVLVAWFAQLCLPVAHAAMMSASSGAMSAWCGDPANSQEALASMPAEIRDALALDGADADHLANCAQLCAASATSAPLPEAKAGPQPKASAQALAPQRRPIAATRRHALPPPSHGPATRA